MLRKGARSTSEIPDAFVIALLDEFSLYREVTEGCTISTVYFGGGTPSMLAAEQFEKIIKGLRANFQFENDIEITFEGEATSLQNVDLLLALKWHNVNRISFGVQTFDEKIRQLLGRTDSIADLFKIREQLNKLGFPEVNVDYLYNLPGTDIKFLSTELRILGSLSPDSLDCHPLKYASCSTSMLQEIVQNEMSIPDAELRIAMFNTIREWTFANKYVEQFADQYSTFTGNHNIYMQHLYGLAGGEYIGMGPAARSHYGDYGFSNFQNVDQYLTHIQQHKRPVAKCIYAPLSDNFITCFPKRNTPVTTLDIKKTSDAAYFKAKLDGLCSMGYVILKNGCYTLTTLGLSWYQNIQEDLLSDDQFNKHAETACKRATKLGRFGDYFANLGTSYQHS